MKRYFTLFISAMLAAATSCTSFHDDLANCLGEVEFRFRIEEQDYPEFGEHIDKVDMFIFDAEGRFVEHLVFTESATPDGIWGTTLTLPAGDYHIVCWGNVGWGNVGDNSAFSTIDENTTLDEGFIELISTQTGDPIYYSPVTVPDAGTAIDDSRVTVPVPTPGEKTIVDLIFMKAHRVVEVFIDGWENVPGTEGGAPNVEQDKAGDYFDFGLDSGGSTTTLTQTGGAENVGGNDMYTTEFISGRIEITDDMMIRVYHPVTGELLVEISLEDYIRENNITDLTYIPILITFSLDPEMNVQVSVEMPNWLDNPIIPEL